MASAVGVKQSRWQSTTRQPTANGCRRRHHSSSPTAPETVAVRGSGAPVSSRPFEGLIQLLPTPSVVAAITRAASTRRGDQNDAEKTPDATPTVDQVLVADGTPRPSADRRGRCGAVPVASEVSAPTPPG